MIHATIRASLVPLLLVVCHGCAREALPPPPPPDDEPTRVRVGDVGASAAEAGPAAVAALRAALRDAAIRLDADERVGRPLVLEGAIAALSRTPQGSGVRVRATVSLSVRDADGGQILVVLDATTQATGPASSERAEQESFDADVISGAVEAVIDQLEPRLSEL